MGIRPLPARTALRPELRTLEAGVVWILRGGLVALAIHSLAIEPRYTTRPLLVASALWGPAVSLAFAFVPTRRPRTLKTAEAALLLALTMHVCGHAFGWYHAFPWYDTMLHLSVPLVSVLMIYALSLALDGIWDWTRIAPFEIGIYLFTITITLGTLWEILEFGMDEIFGTQEQDDLFDTMIDLLMDVLGATIGSTAAAVANAHGRRRAAERLPSGGA